MNTRKKGDSSAKIHIVQKNIAKKNSQEESNQYQNPQSRLTHPRRPAKKDYKQQSQKQIAEEKVPPKRKKQQIKELKTKRRLKRKRSQHSNEVIQIDSFMDEKANKQGKDQKVPQIQQDKSGGQGFKIRCEDKSEDSISLQAHVSSSESSSCSDQHHMQKKQKKGKKHSKTKEKKRRNRSIGLDEENIIEARNRQIPRISYEPPKEEKVKKQKMKANFQNISKDVKKVAEMQDILMSYVVEEGMSGSYKYYKCFLKNNKTVFVKESHMITYFPRRLLQFKQRVINKVAKSTHKLNFVA